MDIVEYEKTKYELVIKSMNIALWDMEVVSKDAENPGTDGVWTWSQEFRNILGFCDESDFPNKIESFLSCLHPEDTENSIEAFDKHIKDRSGKTPYNIEYRLRHKNGEYLYFDGFGTTLIDSEGFPIRISGAIRDITAIKKAGEALIKRDNLLSAVNRTASILLTVKDDETFKNSLTESMKNIGIGVDVDCVEIWKNEMIDGELHAVIHHCWFGENIGYSVASQLTQTFSYNSTPNWERRLAQGECIKGPFYELSPEDQDFIRPFGLKSILAIPIFADGKFWGICCIDDYSKYRNFSDEEVGILRSCALFFVNALIRNEMVREMRKTSDELAFQKTTLQTVVDSIPDIVFCKDLNFRYTLFNTVCIDFLGNEMSKVIGKDDYELGFPDDVAQKMIWADKEILAGKKKLIYDDWVPSEDGSVRYLETTKAPLIRDGNLVGIVGMSRDITEKMQMEKTLQAALEQANAASKAKGDFLSNMSHEMRTPMNAIIGMTAIGKRTDDINEKDNALNKISDASTHLLGVINDVLDMAKIEANKLELAPVEFCFEKMLQNVATVTNFRIDEKQQKFVINIDEKIPEFIIGDDLRLAQVISNLLSNAVKFTSPGGTITLTAKLDAEINGDCELRIEIADNGIGISPCHQEKLFRMFEQADSGTSRQYGGTGLGLVISKRIVELMGGKIWVESQLGKGSCFCFTVKVQSVEASDKRRADRVDENLKLGEFAGKKMLIAEDISINREIVIALLKGSALEIECAENGLEALEAVAADPKKYDIVLMDVQMPQMDGLEATRRIREILKAQDIRLPIVAMTANVFKSDIEACLAAGMDDHLGKPLNMEHVLTVLRKYLFCNA